MSASPRRIGATSLGMSAPVVLVVGVGVDDHVGAELEAGVEPRLEARGQPLVVGELDDVVDAVGSRDLDGGVGGAVVDDQPLDRVEPLDLAGQVRRASAGSCAFLVETGDLDDQLHGPRGASPTARSRRAGGVRRANAPWARAIRSHGSGILVYEDGHGNGKHARATPSALRCRRHRQAAVAVLGSGPRTVAGATCTGPLSGCCWPRRWGCACGASSRDCPTATTPTRRRISCRGRSRSSRMTTTPSTFSIRPRTPTCCTSSSSCGSGARTRCAAPTSPIPTEVFVVARVVAAVLGTVAVWLTYLAGERLFNKTAALLGAAIFGLAFLPIFYSHLALNDVPALAPVALVALRRGRGAAQRGPARLRDRRGGHRAGRGHQVHGRDHRGVPARGGHLRRRRRGAAQGPAPARLRRWPARCWPSSPPTRTRCWTSRPSTPG